MKNVIIIIAEGRSEKAYLEELNRFLREEEIDYVFYPVIASGGEYSEVRRVYKDTAKNNRNCRIEILVDRDIYIRDEKNIAAYRKREHDGLPRFLFSYMNFEDFLVLHLKKEKVREWNKIISERGHNIIPLTAKEYIPLIHESSIFGSKHYKKGNVPFEITWTRLFNLIRNDRNEGFFMHSDFTDLLYSILPINMQS